MNVNGQGNKIKIIEMSYENKGKAYMFVATLLAALLQGFSAILMRVEIRNSLLTSLHIEVRALWLISNAYTTMYFQIYSPKLVL